MSQGFLEQVTLSVCLDRMDFIWESAGSFSHFGFPRVALTFPRSALQPRKVVGIHKCAEWRGSQPGHKAST